MPPAPPFLRRTPPSNAARLRASHARQTFIPLSPDGRDALLYYNVFVAEKVGQDDARSMRIPHRLVGCANNTMVWLGPGAYPAPLPACFTTGIGTRSGGPELS